MRHRWTETELDKVRELISQGYTSPEIGEQLGTSAKAIQKVCIYYGLQLGPVGGRSGEKSMFWNGGRIVDKNGYIYILMKDHPFSNCGGYVREHRLVMEQKLGRYLTPVEVVHHIDGDKQNNHPDNLEVYAKNSDHLRVELTGKVPKWGPEGFANIQYANRHRWDADYVRRSTRSQTKTDDPQKQ